MAPLTQNPGAGTGWTCIEPVVEQHAARERLQRGRWARLRSVASRYWQRWFGRPGPLRRLVRMEILWLPCYQITFRWDGEPKGSACVHILVGGYDGKAVLWDLAGVRWIPPAGETFPPEVTEQQAVRIACRTLSSARWRHAGWRRGSPEWSERQVRLIHYPYWAAYFRCRGGRLDVAVVDALTGQPTGPAGKVSLLAALTRGE